MKYLLENHESERLRYRPVEDDDFKVWLNLFIGQNVAGFLGMAAIPEPIDQCLEWFRILKNRYENELGGMNALIDKKTNALVGQCGLLVQEVDGLKELEIGYSILPKYRGHGYATEAARTCRDFAFNHSFSDTLISIIHVDNIKSKKVALRNGMTLDKETVFKGMPVHVFRITHKQWLNPTSISSILI